VQVLRLADSVAEALEARGADDVAPARHRSAGRGEVAGVR
jgi:hypothetical protein